MTISEDKISSDMEQALFNIKNYKVEDNEPVENDKDKNNENLK